MLDDHNKNNYWNDLNSLRGTALTCGYEFPIMQQASVIDKVIQGDSLQQVFQTLGHKKFNESLSSLTFQINR